MADMALTPIEPEELDNSFVNKKIVFRFYSGNKTDFVVCGIENNNVILQDVHNERVAFPIKHLAGMLYQDRRANKRRVSD
jgi:hypothetical protein